MNLQTIIYFSVKLSLEVHYNAFRTFLHFAADVKTSLQTAEKLVLSVSASPGIFPADLLVDILLRVTLLL